MGNLIVTFKNGSDVEWYPDNNSDSGFEHAGSSINSWPNAPLLPMTGNGSCNIGIDLDHLAEGPASFWYCWNDGIWRFGVKVSTHTQNFSMGSRPSWQVMSDQNLNSTSIDWQDNGSNPGDQYSWPTTIGYSISATPTSSHETLSIAVVISGLPKSS
jgi:hypothetical protein